MSMVEPIFVIEEALAAAFGTQPRSALVPLTGGMSGAAIFAFEAGGRSLVVRRSAVHPQGAEQVARELRCMQLAASIGVAPEILHLDEERGLVVMDRIEGSALGRREPPDRVTGRLAEVLRRLHRGPAFPRGLAIAEMTAMLDRLEREQLATSLPERLVHAMGELSAALASFDRTAPCHYDLNPMNLLFRGDRVYLVDWELACQGDPYLDLAQLGVFLFPRSEGRAALHAAYLERAPTAEEEARMYLTRAMALGYYAAGFHHVAARTGTLGAWPLVPPVLGELFAELAATGTRPSPPRFAAALLAELDAVMAAPEYARARAKLA